MNILLSMHLLHPMYHLTCIAEGNTLDIVDISCAGDFINMYDGCAFE
jgi:hypothetical protein